MINVRNLRLNYGASEILNIPRLDIDVTKITALTGSNGSGKSTLMRVMSFLQKPTSGEVRLWGSSAPSLNLLRDVSVLLPEPALLKRSVRENFRAVLKSRGVLGEFDERASEALNLVGLDESFLSKRHFELSSGQTQRVSFALNLALRSRLYLLDEPTNSVDAGTSKLFGKAVLYMQQRYSCGFVIASHDDKWLSAVAKENVFLHKGRVCEFEYKNVFDSRDGVLKFDENASVNLPQNLRNAVKIAVNPSKITLSKTPIDGYLGGILHSVSLYLGKELLVKIKVGDFLIKTLAANSQNFRVGENIYFKFDEEAFLGLE
ncbi:tungstate ABC transporter ATP-binding protein TupC [Campylobacter concisus]|uniref:tungstate ABC transporter ATP-binding protein TupC n=1 Tax=Campylobacter concisus TaxID=199 RepID=UPI000CD93785|nr:tungstate ABC transporter ATP-binding protein TupC [Campylobacter concisus]